VQKLEKTAKAWAITGSRLNDGLVLYATPGGTWSERFADAEIFTDKPAADAGLKRAEAALADQIMLSAYLFEVALGGDAPAPASVREQIRARGPTVRLDLGKQAAHA
jgi:hypothetical protein